jgi:hypothetical protein
MGIVFQFLLLIILPGGSWALEPCAGSTINNEADAIKVLQDSNHQAKDAPTRACITAAIDLVSELHSQKGVPELIRYISYERDNPPEAAKGVIFYLPFEGYDHPAVPNTYRFEEHDRSRIHGL